MKFIIDVIIMCGISLNKHLIDPDTYFILMILGSFFVGYNLCELLNQKKVNHD